jgi:hypothetical protein
LQETSLPHGLFLVSRQSPRVQIVLNARGNGK